jgi:antitoxin component of MazEF toxin-antitoxin module|tara:strand:+ start:597 stop:797 length:201 start_codon:yes stop_codon:yes gene_type:complete
MLVSLPKHYVHLNGLRVGDELWGYVDGDRLILTPNRLEREEVDEVVGPHESNRESRAREREYLTSR